MKGVILDSDILIELLRGRDLTIASRFELLLSGAIPLWYSAVSAAEIEQGARENELEAISALLAFFTCLPADCAIAAEAGEILKRFRKSCPMGLGDALIAATAIRHDLVLWTRNRKHYPDARLQFFKHP